MTARTTNLEPILLNDFRRQWSDVGDGVLAATRRVGESGWYILGGEVKAFEQDLAASIGRKHVIGCANGMDALEISLRALGLKPGARVLTTSLSAFATTLAIVRAGGVPVFVDVDEYGLLDLERARHALQQDPSIRYLVPVHLYGHALDLERLEAMKQQFRLEVVEDCCQAIGAAWGGTPVGSVGAMGALSFYPTKNLGILGDGGAILTDSEELAVASRTLRDYGQSAKYRHELLGLNSRLDELHAATLSTALLPKLDEWTSQRRAIAHAYVSGISNERVVVPGAPSRSNSVWHLFPVLVPREHRDHFRAHLSAEGISSAVHYPEMISNQAALQSVPFELLEPLSRTSKYCEQEVSLPIHPYMNDAEVTRVIEAVNAWRWP